MAATESLDSSTPLVTTATASQATESDTVSITAIIHNPQSDEGCDSPDSSDGSTQISSQVMVTSPASEPHTPHYIVAEGATRSYTSLTTVSTAVTDDETVGEVSTVHPTYVQYTVDGTEQAIYATTTNGQITYPVFAVGENYTPGSGQYYTSGNTAVTYTQVAQTGQSLITGSTYLIQPTVDHESAHTIITGSRTSPDTVNADGAGVYMVSSNSSVSMEGERIDSNISNATRVSPATVQWLLENYECFEGVSLPRSTMYAHYLRHCSEHKLDPVNAASFGKLIRSVFLGLRTRRLGTRGNSKYHYYGIRIKPGSSLTHISVDPVVNTPRGSGTANNKRFKQATGMKTENQYESSGNHNTSPQANDNQQYLGDGLGAIPEFPAIKLNSFLEETDVTLEDVDTLRNIYREHCEAFLEAVLNLEFQTIESLWREFWRSQDNNNGDECEEEKYLSKSKLYSLCKLQPIQEFMRSVDYVFYQNIVQVLIPDVLRPIPSSLTQSIRNFAKGLENWLTGAMNGCPQEMVLIKVSAVSALAQTLRRYTSLNHLAQAARAVLQNSSQITQMLADLNRVDFHNVQEQASWVCECEDSVVQRLEADFKSTLQQQNSLESWALWLKNVVSQVLKPFEGKPNFAKAARQFLLKWSFYSSMVIRDLTLRSAASFGSFHLIRLLYDEYMFYLVEHEVALATGETPIAVMSEMEWVEIIEPRTKEHMYANLTTGECVWDPPLGVIVKETDDNQWWELFDQNTSRFYYYNAISQETVWHRPSDCDIIPLAKLQILKQNTEPEGEDKPEECKSKESVGTQTPGKCVRPPRPLPTSHAKSSVSCETQTSPGNSPRAPRRSHHHSHSHTHSHGHSHHHHHSSNAQQKTPQKTNQSQDSGRSSDSSSRTSLDNNRILESPRHNRYQGTSLPISTSTSAIDKKPLQESNLQATRGSGDNNLMIKSGSKSNSGSTTTSQSIISGFKPGLNISVAKQKSFDVETSLGIGGCYSNYGHENFRGRSKPEKSVQTPKEGALPGNGSDLARSYSFIQRRDISHDEEDSMHEKYFLTPSQSGIRSIESTPQARRKQIYSSSSKSSKDLDLVTVTPSRTRRVHKSNESNRGRECRRFSKENEYQSNSSENESSNTSQSPATTSPSSPVLSARKNNRLNQVNIFTNIDPPPYRHPNHSNGSKTPAYEEIKENQRKIHLKETFREQQNDTGGDKYKKQMNREPTESKERVKPKNYNESRDIMRGDTYKDKTDYRQIGSRELYRENGNHGNVPSQIKFYSMERGYEKANSTPLYSNIEYQPYSVDIKNQSHMFPLQQYILEQAKLSGCYKFGDPLNDEMDSLHSEDEASVGRADYDSDEFADDEGMSNQGDSSSQEYLHDPNYSEQEEFLKKYENYSRDYKNDLEYIESLESRMAVNTVSQGVYYSGVASTPYHPRLPPIVTQNASETQHTSLKRKKDTTTAPISSLYSPILEKTENANRPLSLPSQTIPEDVTDHRPESPKHVLSRDKKLPSESDIEEYAQGHLNIHKKGIFRKKFSVRDMLSWSKDPIRKPMLVLAEKALKKDACELFKLVQIYMSDRKAKIGMTLNSVALEICNLGYNKPFLRDELYIQICRQTTENPRRESLRRGWELMAICLNFFPPSAKFQSYLEGYINRHRDPGFDFPEVVKWPIHVQISHYATISCKRLERIGTNGKKPPRKATIEEIDQSRLQIFRASMFGSTLEEVMYLQKERFPNRRLPWIQTVLSEEILRLQGAQTEGIFRVSADVDEVNSLKTKIDHWEVPTETIDAHAPASLLKLWYRELYEPLIPDALYNECVTHHDNPDFALAIVQRLPNLNRLVLCYLVRFLQIFSRDEVVHVTKMDASNLAMVMAPNCLRCTSQDPSVIFDNARKEMSFMKTLIQSLDTSFMEGIF